MRARGVTDRAYLKACLEEAWFALKDNRLRTMMSIIGIAVGIASVITISVVSETGRRYIFSELETFGFNTIWVYRKHDQANPTETSRLGSGITNDDYEQMNSSCCPSVVRYSPVVYMQDFKRLLKVGNSFSKSAVEGVGLEYLSLNRDEVVMGRNFSVRDIEQRRGVAIIGQATAKRLFGDLQSPLGRDIRMDDVRLTIVGVLKYKSREFLSSIGATQGYDINDRLLIPYTLYQQLLGSDDIYTLQAEAASQEQVESAVQQIVSALQRSHKNRYEYQADNMLAWIKTANTILNNVSFVGLFAASVSLIVGGIGILNIMSTSIIERTREIGLRKALGATHKDIMYQFIIEAAYISTLGGALGIVLAIIVTLALTVWTGFVLFPSLSIMFTGIFISVLVGMASGAFPAHRAAKMQPMVALRYE